MNARVAAIVCFFMAAAAEATTARVATSDESLIPYEDDYMSDWNPDWTAVGGRSQTPKCINIPANLTLCRGIGYTEMRLPNLLDHDTVGEVSQQAKSWVPLTNIGCHPDTKLFLCSLFSPICLNRPIWPCRTLCEAVKRGCEGRMLKYGFPWPEMLRCDKFPLDNDLCIGQQTHVKPDTSECQACKQPTTVEAIIDHFCSADFALKIQIRKTTRRRGEIKLKTTKKKRIFKTGPLSKREIRKANFIIEGAENCHCESLSRNGASSSSSSSKQFQLVMGRKVGDKLVLSFIRIFEKQNKQFRKAVRTMKNNKNICKGGVEALTVGGADGDKADHARNQRKRERKSRRTRKTGRRNQQRNTRPRRRQSNKAKISK